MTFFLLIGGGGSGTPIYNSTLYNVEIVANNYNVSLRYADDRENRCLYSEDLSNPVWIYDSGGTTYTSNAIANPVDGAITADKLYETATGGIAHVSYQTLTATFTSGLTYRFSIYLKNAGRKFVYFNIVGAAFTSIGVEINLALGTLTSGPASKIITSLGSGWYRISFEATAIATGQVSTFYNFRDDASLSTYTGDGSSGVYFYGAQVQITDASTTYLSTTSTAKYMGTQGDEYIVDI